MVLAQEEARMLNHNYIGTEHLLLGLIHEGEGIGARALESLGVTLNAVREQVQSIVGPSPQAPSGHIPFTPRAKKVLELSMREAIQLNHGYIGTEHILLGMVRASEGVANQVLSKVGVQGAEVRQAVMDLIPDTPATTRIRKPPVLARATPARAPRQARRFSTSSGVTSPPLHVRVSLIR